MEIINLTNEQLKKLSTKIYAEGNKSTIYRGSTNRLYKIYNGEVWSKEENYETILLATERQKKIKETQLPLGVVNVENEFAGTILKPHFYHFPVQMINMFPAAKQIEILKQVVNNVKELTENSVYPLDISYYDFNNPRQSSVLVSPKGKVEIVGLDGSSVIYPNDRLYSYEQLVLNFTNALIDDLMKRTFPTRGTIISKGQTYKEALFDSKIDESSVKDFLKGELSYDGIDNLIDQVMVKKGRF